MTQDTESPQVDLRRFRLAGTSAGDMVVELDGKDISRSVYGVHLNIAADLRNPFAHVVLELSPLAGSEFDGMARVAIGEQPDPGPAAVQFLTAMDPKELERVALQRLDIDTGEGGLTGAMLRQLIEWASGRS